MHDMMEPDHVETTTRHTISITCIPVDELYTGHISMRGELNTFALLKSDIGNEYLVAKTRLY